MWRTGVVVWMVAMAACTPPPVPQGKWACLSDDGRLFIDVVYAGDGTKTGTARMTQADGAIDFDVQMKFQGIWSLKDDKLTES
ncbi:MAG: hypothetical protein Q8R82_22120, partial [Hyphomonadaceae bacterium]|nr:hypothetical protein [Hyphomonadaceae bacterium]